MRSLKLFAVLLLLISGVVAGAKDKKKILLPADVLRARTVLVLIEPMAGIAVDAPNANRAARSAVERELMNWGRFEIVNNVSMADLIITVRKGNGKLAQPTIGGIPQNQRPVIFQPSDSGGIADASQAGPTASGDPTVGQRPNPMPQAEVGPTEDMFAVYRGRRDDPLDSSPVWRYISKGSLDTPRVRAVEEFRKLIVEAEKQEADSN
jgi:hypothetical protein